MGVENAQMMWLKTPSHCYTILEKTLRKVTREKGAGALANELADMTDLYWVTYCDMHDTSKDLQENIQSWYMFQAMVKILKTYGWWNKDKNIPVNWQQEEPI